MTELDKVAENVVHQCGRTLSQLYGTDEENIKILIAEYSIDCENNKKLISERDNFLAKVYGVQE